MLKFNVSYTKANVTDKTSSYFSGKVPGTLYATQNNAHQFLFVSITVISAVKRSFKRSQNQTGGKLEACM